MKETIFRWEKTCYNIPNYFSTGEGKELQTSFPTVATFHKEKDQDQQIPSHRPWAVIIVLGQHGTNDIEGKRLIPLLISLAIFPSLLYSNVILFDIIFHQWPDFYKYPAIPIEVNGTYRNINFTWLKAISYQHKQKYPCLAFLHVSSHIFNNCMEPVPLNRYKTQSSHNFWLLPWCPAEAS